MRFKKLLVPVLVMTSMAVAINAYLAQSPRKPAASENATSQAPFGELEQEARIRNKLAALLADVGVQVGKTLPRWESQTYKEIRVRWQSSMTVAHKGAANLEQRPSPGLVTLMNATKRAGTLPRERSVELSTNHILLVAIDENGELTWWRVLLDPRLVRSETAGVTGDISGETYYLTRVDFIIAYPDDSAIKELRFYQPLWSGKEFHLNLFSTLPLE